ncbi:ABC transporter transmembrane domain-containing protein [Paenibacillus sp. CC-CFT747]|nr:ABC transporter transmembrane domain-containing protein [Paenibacillus sp. CC-CFT747]
MEGTFIILMSTVATRIQRIGGELRRTIVLVRPYLWTHRMAYAALAVLYGLELAQTLVYAWYYGALTDAAIHTQMDRLKSLLLLGAGLLAASAAIAYLHALAETAATTGVKRDMEKALYKRLLLLPASELSGHRSGDLVSRFANDLHSIGGVLGGGLMEILRLPVVYAAVFVYLYQLNGTIALVSLCAAPAALAAGAASGWLLRRNGREVQRLLGTMSSLLNETIRGHGVVRAYALERMLYRKYAGFNRELYRLERQNAKLSGAFQAGASRLARSFL